MSSTTKTYLKSDNYLQPSSSHSYDPSQSPLALLAQTCSSIGNDCPSSPLPIITKPSPDKSSSSTKPSPDKSSSSTKHSLSFTTNPTKKSSHTLKTNRMSTYSNPIRPVYIPPVSLGYLSSQHSNSSSCIFPGCLQCETVRYILSNSLNNQPYRCHWSTCNERFYSHNELLEHIWYQHRTSKISNHSRFYPYLKPSRMINNNDQLPFFYPHLSLSSMTEATHRSNNSNNNN